MLLWIKCRWITVKKMWYNRHRYFQIKNMSWNFSKKILIIRSKINARYSDSKNFVRKLKKKNTILSHNSYTHSNILIIFHRKTTLDRTATLWKKKRVDKRHFSALPSAKVSESFTTSTFTSPSPYISSSLATHTPERTGNISCRSESIFWRVSAERRGVRRESGRTKERPASS